MLLHSMECSAFLGCISPGCWLRKLPTHLCNIYPYYMTNSAMIDFIVYIAT